VEGGGLVTRGVRTELVGDLARQVLGTHRRRAPLDALGAGAARSALGDPAVENGELLRGRGRGRRHRSRRVGGASPHEPVNAPRGLGDGGRVERVVGGQRHRRATDRRVRVALDAARGHDVRDRLRHGGRRGGALTAGGDRDQQRPRGRGERHGPIDREAHAISSGVRGRAFLRARWSWDRASPPSESRASRARPRG